MWELAQGDRAPKLMVTKLGDSGEARKIKMMMFIVLIHRPD